MTRRPNSSLPKFVAGVGIFRTLTCGGWTYVTSTDAHDWHDIFMISYLVATLPWTLGCLALSPRNPAALQYRKLFAGSFFATLVPLVYFFIQHKVHHVAGGMLVDPNLACTFIDTRQHIPSTLSSNGHLSSSM
jgi:peptidoglycan biosynthesis protein MviN/MurJ (putative lipid II flippase)